MDEFVTDAIRTATGFLRLKIRGIQASGLSFRATLREDGSLAWVEFGGWRTQESSPTPEVCVEQSANGVDWVEKSVTHVWRTAN